jgi:DICT domain-containing protein
MTAETGLSAAVLRAWEQRYGFPTPGRSASGHRRYDPGQVEQVRRVLRDRAAGMSLEAAVARARDRAAAAEPSIFAGLRRRHPALPVHVLSPRGMLAISRAIEDECFAQAEAPVLVGSFQRHDLYERSAARWRELARTAAAAVVLAEFDRHRARPGAPIEVALAPAAPLRREWAVVCDAPGVAACLAGVERAPAPGRPRTFEAVWTVDPAIVRDATELALALARHHGDGVDEIASIALPPVVHDDAATILRATAITSRIVAYLDDGARA